MTNIPKDGKWVTRLRREVAARAVKGRRRAMREAGIVDPIETRPLVDLKTGQVVHVPMLGNDLPRVIIGMIGGLSERDLIALAVRHGIPVHRPSQER